MSPIVRSAIAAAIGGIIATLIIREFDKRGGFGGTT